MHSTSDLSVRPSVRLFVRAAMLLLSLMLSATTAWADGLSGSGTKTDPWLINNVDDWNTFASSAAYWASGTYVKLAADIPTADDIATGKSITTTVGTSSYLYQGTFNGDSHTLTLSLEHTSGGNSFLAPFKYIYNATIMRLHTAGTISTNGKMAGGIAGDSYGTSTIQSCWSSVTISSSISGEGTHGGLVGMVGNYYTLTLTDCLFDGSITYSGSDETKTHGCGGLVGWKGGALKLNHCLQAGDLTGLDDNDGATICRYSSGSVDFGTCYYRTAYGTSQGTQTAATGSDLLTLLGSGWEVSGTDVFPIMRANPKDLTEGTITGVKPHYKYTGNEINVTCTVKDAAGNTLTEGTDYTATLSGTVKELGKYTLSIAAKSGNAAGYFGSVNIQIEVWPWSDDATAGGYCGDPAVNDGKDVYYEITGGGSEKTITIHGTGAMKDLESCPWYDYRYDIKYGVIDNGVTTIAPHAFEYCSKMADITIPAGVTSIGKYAFYDCDNLKAITIPASVTTIGACAFDACDYLESVTFAEGSQLTTIGEEAFCYCYRLKAVTIPASVTAFGKYAFYSCTMLESVTFEENSQLTTIGEQAFCDCDRLKAVTIPASVTTMDDYAFWGCDDLTTVEIGSALATVGTGVFSTGERLTTLTVDPANEHFQAIGNVLFSKDGKTLIAYPRGLTETAYTIPDGVTAISSYAFYKCEDLAAITIPASVKSIGEYAFYGTTFIDEQEYEDGVFYINKMAVAFNGTYSEVTLKSGTTAIAGGAFDSCNTLTSITIPASVTSIGDDAFWKCENLESVTFEEGSGLTSIGDYAFEDCYKLRSITIPAGVTSIGKEAFYECYKLRSITIPAGVTSLGESVFYDCRALTTVDFAEGSQLTTIGKYAFEDCYALTGITIPASVTSIGKYAFEDCERMRSITIPAGVKSIEEGTFYDCYALTEITFEEGSQLTTIGDYAFEYCEALPAITIPAGVTSIGDDAFLYCHHLESVTFEEGSELTSIGKYAFYDCYALPAITIPAGVTSIDSKAFSECSNIADVYCYADPTQLTWTDAGSDFMSSKYTMCHVENAADWSDFEDEVNVTFTGGYCGNNGACQGGKNLRWDATRDAKGDKTLRIFRNPDAEVSSPEMEHGVNFGSTDYAGIIIEDGVGNIGNNAFSGFSEITSVTIPASVKEIGEEAFYNCDRLKSILVLATEPPTLDRKVFAYLDGEAVFTVPNSDYLTAWSDVAEHTGDYDGYEYQMVVLGDEFKTVTYIDEKGEEATSPLAFPIAGSDTEVILNYSGDTWYYVSGDVTVDGGLYFNSNTGSTNLVLCDGATLTVNDIYAANNLNIYQQAEDQGVGAIVISTDSYAGIGSSKDININGGDITIDQGNDYAISSEGRLTVNAGNITVDNCYDDALYAKNHLTVNGGNITVNNCYDNALYAEYYLTVNGGNIHINGARNGIYALKEDISIYGGSINITDADYGIYADYEDISIYGGSINITATDYGLYTNDDDINIYGGSINITATDYGLYAEDEDISIYGGKVIAEGSSYGMYAYDDINLSWSNFGDYIYANSYYDNYDDEIYIMSGSPFTYHDGTKFVYADDDTQYDPEDFADHFLFPVIDDITLKANSDGEGSYWATFYCGHTGYTADGHTTVYKGQAGDDCLQLTAVEDIPAGNAVILRSTSPTIRLTSATTAGADLTDNELLGTDINLDTTDLTDDAYCLSKGEDGVGFYIYTGIIPANRAYLMTGDGVAPARYRFTFGEDDNQATTINAVKTTEESDAIYDLQGRRVAEPTKGMYIVNGKKVFIK